MIITKTTKKKKNNNYAKIILVLSLNWAVIKYSNSDATFSNIAKLTRNQTFYSMKHPKMTSTYL